MLLLSYKNRGPFWAHLFCLSACLVYFTVTISAEVPAEQSQSAGADNMELGASFEDTRCKCVCDKTWDASGKETRAVFINTTEHCDCQHVVLPLSPNLPCARCLCRTEMRNTTTIKVVVIFIICVVSLLFVYMLFLLCLDPLIQRRPASYQQHHNEESSGPSEEDMSSGPRTEEATTPTALAPSGPSPQTLSARQRSLLTMVSKEQKKWKGTVQEQRKNIYDRHSMLN